MLLTLFTFLCLSFFRFLSLCSPTTGQCGEAMKEHTGTIRVVKFLSEHSSGSAGSALLASAGAGDCKPRLWDAHAGTLFSNLESVG